MDLRILGCHGSDGVLDGSQGAQDCNTCGFLLNGTVLVDAGTVATKLPLKEQQQIRHILLSHLHFDHIKGLPTFADNISGDGASPVTVASLSDVITGLKAHIFNAAVYPDFFTIPTPNSPTLVSQILDAGTTYGISGLEVTPILVNHTVPAVGFIVQDAASAFLYSGDTYLTDALWLKARQIPQLKAAFVECSYPNTHMELARISKHLTPSLLAQELKKLARPDIAIYAYHLKPAHKTQITRELKDLGLPNLTVLTEGQTITV